MRLARLLLVVAIAAPVVTSAAQQTRPKLKILVVTDGPSPTFDAWVSELKRETQAQLEDRYEVDLQRRTGDWTLEGASQQLDRAYSDPEARAVFGVGTLTAKAVAQRPDFPRTTLLPFVIEAEAVGLPRKGDASGRTNLSYIAEDANIEPAVRRLQEIADSKSIAIVVDPAHEAIARTAIARNKQAANLTIVVADETAAPTLASIPSDADGVVLGVLPRLSVDERTALLAGLRDRRLANVALGGPTWVEQGALMTTRPRDGLQRRVQRAALNLALILDGRRARAMHVVFESRPSLLINIAEVRALGVRASFEMLTEAEVINERKPPPGSQIQLGAAMNEAVEGNLLLLSERKNVEAGAQEVKSVRGALLPQADATAGVTQIDPDRAFPITRAERQANWSARAQQILYSEAAWTSFSSIKHVQSAREEGYKSEKLNIMLEAGVSYVNVLRAGTAERIQRKNIKRTRENLELARSRVDAGVANRSELYRWQIEIAENQRDVIDARALRSQAEIELNRVLNRPIDQGIAPVDPLFTPEPGMREANRTMTAALGAPWSFDQLSAFMVEEGLHNSPEVREIDRSVRAQERTIEGQRRSLWLPTIFAEGGVTHDFWRDGEGSSVPAGSALPPPDDFGWDVGLFMSLPLSRGGTQIAEIRRSARLIDSLEASRARIKQEIETLVRSELYVAGAAYAAVTLTKKAADAAAGNLTLVIEQYRQGGVDIITLVDAQTQTLIADLNAADAAYDYLIALLRVDRAIGHFRNLDSTEEQQAFAERLDAFLRGSDAASPASPQ